MMMLSTVRVRGITGVLSIHPWAAAKPDNEGGNRLCTEMLPDGSWSDLSRDNLRYFACCDGISNSFVVVDGSMNASDARQYCREYSTHLASIWTASDNEKIQTLAGGQSV